MKALKFDSRLVHYLLYCLIGVLVIGSLAGTELTVNLLQGQANSLLQLKAKSQALNSEQVGLISAKKEVKQYTALKNIAETIVPQNKNQAKAVREIVALASASHITLTSITFPSSTLGNSSTTGAAPAAGTAVSTSASLSQLVPVQGIPGVYSLAIEIENDQSSAVSYANFYSFLTKLEQNRLTSQVTGLSINPLNNAANDLTFSLTINEYIRPDL